jgi:Chaperone of endosialidase
MNPLIQLKKSTALLLIVLLLACIGLLPRAQAVVPAPDGGYPGGNTAEGQNALLSLTSGGFNTAVGFLSLRSNTEGQFNTATGAGALLANTAEQNTATGAGALLSNTVGDSNTAHGAFSLFSNLAGDLNTAIGYQALFRNIGPGNTAIGSDALYYNTTGSGNIAFGQGAGTGVSTANNVICIGTTLSGENISNSCYIGEIFGATSSGGAAVLINLNGKLGTMTSSRRFKDEIKPMDKASEAVFALKPVTFRYKKEIDSVGTPQFGLVAEEVEKVNPDLVVRDKEGKPYSVRYDQVNAMLLNEFLKEHRKNEEQQKQIEALTAELKEQAAQIQKVSAQLEASKPAPQVVKNDH